MLSRREFIKKMVWAGIGASLPFSAPSAAPPPALRIALLHLAPVPGDLAGNRRLVQGAVSAAAAAGAHWVVTPELCTSGYGFSDRIGTDWIAPQPDGWTRALGRQAAGLGVTVFLSQAEKDPHTGKLHNATFVIGPGGDILGSHRKIRTLKVGAEAWSSPGEAVRPVAVPPLGDVGILICADAYPPWIAKQMKARGADILISPAAWGPGPCGPSGEWERCSRDTGLSMLVCNRTGVDSTLDFRAAETVVVQGGRRLYSLTSPDSAMFLLDWDRENGRPVRRAPVRVPLES